MKIIKTAEQVSAYNKQKEIATRGCNVCPCCHETMSFGEAVREGYGFSRGISSIFVQRLVDKGWFSSEYQTVTIYSCKRCGAEWESDPY